MSATGIIIFQSHCICTGDEQMSLYISPATCEDNYHSHHTHKQGGEEVPSTAGECHECASHTKECGCNDTKINFIKLKNEVVHEKTRTLTKQPVKIVNPELYLFVFTDILKDLPENEIIYIEPPSDKTSLDFLIPIHQLKIPYLA